MLKDLVKLANRLDSKGLRKEADYLDAIVKVATLEDDKLSGYVDLLNEALATLNALRNEMDPNFGPELYDEEPNFDPELYDEEEEPREDEPRNEWETETAWNALHKNI